MKEIRLRHPPLIVDPLLVERWIPDTPYNRSVLATVVEARDFAFGQQPHSIEQRDQGDGSDESNAAREDH